MRAGDVLAAVTGGLLGVAVVCYFFVYVPMAENIRTRGCPFLVCESR